MSETEIERDAASRRRSMIVLLGGMLAAAFAVLSIVGPANHETTTIAWPAAGEKMMGPAPVGTPILLAERQPESFSARIPCAAVTAPTVSTSDRRVLLATARRPGPIDALVIAAVDDEVRVVIGTKTVARAVVEPSSGCEVLVSCADGAWSLIVNGVRRGSWQDTAPVMSGLYTDVPPSSAGTAAPKVELTTYAQTSSPSREQWLWMAAALVAGVIVLVSILRLDRAGADAPNRWRDWRPPPLRRTDAAMFSLIAVWAVLAGPQSDDGWVMSTVANQRASGSFGNYYDALNANLTLGYLHDQLFHVMSSVSHALLWFRVPVVLAWCVVWYVTRVLFDRFAAGVDVSSSVLRWGRVTLGSMFFLAIVAVGMSIRPEFLTGLAAMIVSLLADRFRRRSSVGLLVAMVITTAVAISVHTVGVVCLAPLIVAVPTIWRWLRADHSGGLLRFTGGTLVAAALGLLLIFADSDTQIFRHSLDLTALTGVHDGGLLSEGDRYSMLFSLGWGLTSLRLFVLLPTLASFGLISRALVLQRRGEPSDPIVFQMWWLVGVATLAVVPSKWPVHFAALTGFGSLAVATAVVSVAAAAPTLRQRRPVLRWGGSGVVVAAMAGLTYLAYGLNVSPELWVNDSTALPWIVARQRLGARAAAVVGVIGVVGWAVRTARRSERPANLGRSVVAGIPAVLAIGIATSIVGASVGALGVSSGWSVGRQNLGLTGGCGLASRLDVADPSKMTDLPMAADEDSGPEGLDEVAGPEGTRAWRDPGDVTSHAGAVELPWQHLDDTRFVGLWMSGQWWSDHATTFVLEFGTRRGDKIVSRARVRYQPFRSAFAAPDRWRFFVAQVPSIHADALRVVIDDTKKRRGWLGISTAVGIGSTRLDTMIESADKSYLVDVSSVPFFPCSRPPSIVRGVSELPDHTIEPGYRNGVGLTIFGRSPVFMQADAFEIPFDILPTVYSSAPEGEYPGALIVTVRPDELAPFDATGIDLD